MKLKTIKIGDFGEIITGNTPPKDRLEFYGKEYKFIKPTDMDVERKFTPVTEEYYSQEGYKKYEKSVIPPLSTCVVTIGSIGKKMTLSDDYCFVNQAVNAIVPNQAKYHPHFVYYALRNNLHRVKAADTGASSGRENVSKSNFSGLTIEVPESLQTQQKIAAILSAYDDLIENNLRRIRLFEAAAQHLYREWFVEFRFPGWEEVKVLAGLPEGWVMGSVGQLCKVKSGYAFKSKDWRESGNPVIKITNIGNNTVDTLNCDFVEDEIAKVAEKFELYKGEMVIAMTGATIGKVGLIPKIEKPIFLNQRVGVFKPLAKSKVFTSFLFAFFTLDNAQRKVINLAQGAAQPNISTSQIESIEVIIGSEIVLDEFCRMTNPFLEQIQILNYSNQKLKEARDILLPRLMDQTIEI